MAYALSKIAFFTLLLILQQNTRILDNFYFVVTGLSLKKNYAFELQYINSRRTGKAYSDSYISCCDYFTRSCYSWASKQLSLLLNLLFQVFSL